jgi:hypothetical protein
LAQAPRCFAVFPQIISERDVVSPLKSRGPTALQAKEQRALPLFFAVTCCG